MSKRVGYSKYSKLKIVNESSDGEVQNRAASRVYVFGNDSTEDLSLDDAGEMSEVRSRSKRHSATGFSPYELKKTLLIERDIKSEDSLQKFALNFGCTMEEIKRANNLYSEQDFHALQKIKIPVQPHGMFAEEDEKLKNQPEPLNLNALTSEINGTLDDDDNEQDVRTISIRSALDSPHSFLRSMDEDLKMICKGASLRKANLDEVARTLTVTCIHPLKLQAEKRDLGQVWGIGWKGFAVLGFIIGIVVPGVIAAVWLWPRSKS